MIPLIVTGMVRSGTTLISRSLNAHPNIICPPDPYMGFFRSLRNDLYKRIGSKLEEPESPLSDLFCDPGPTLTDMGIMNLDLQIGMPIKELTSLIRQFAASNVPGLLPLLYKLNGDKYQDIFLQLLKLLKVLFNEKSSEIVGFKQTWVEAMIAPLYNSIPDMICVHVIRDPRAVVASWKKTEDLSHDYPFLMMIRHWRKSVASALANQNRFPNYYVVRYEDFVDSHDLICEKICEHIRIPFDESMVDFRYYRSGTNDLWKHNSSYPIRGNGIKKSFRNAWKDRLKTADIRLIEFLAEPEMKLCNYEIYQNEMSLLEWILAESPLRDVFVRTDWMSKYLSKYHFDSNNLSLEFTRKYLWQNRSNKIPNELACKFFVSPEILSQQIYSIRFM